MMIKLEYCNDENCEQDFIRASGNCECPICKKLIKYHPTCKKYNFLTVLCDGQHVKL
jgi:hypothetical protein